MSAGRHIIAALAVALLLCSCSGKPRIIPRSTLQDIYIDMFMADQWLSDHPGERSATDTLLFYDPIFKRYGYTFEDYDATIQRYLKDPEKFHRIFRDANIRLKMKRDYYRKKADELEEIREINSQIKGYSRKDFDADTILWRPESKDTLDSTLRDTLLRDSLLRDTLAVVDSVVLDTVAVQKLPVKERPVLERPRRDTLKRVHLKRNLLITN